MKPQNKAKLPNKQINNAFITDVGNTPSLSYSNILSNVSEMVDLDTTVSKAISSMKSSVSNTPDQISVLFLRKTTTSLSLPLSLPFNMALK